VLQGRYSYKSAEKEESMSYVIETIEIYLEICLLASTVNFLYIQFGLFRVELLILGRIIVNILGRKILKIHCL